jgi:type III restriction enzyme
VKIKCSEKHFEEIAPDTDEPAKYIKATDFDGMMDYTF